MSRLAAFYQSTIGKKIIMAMTGLIGVGFLISHVASNLLYFRDPRHLDEYGAMLRSLGPLLWLARLGLVVAVVLHVLMAVQLTARKRAARPVAYQKRDPQTSTWGSRTMFVGGLLLLAFIVFHLLHFTLGVVTPGFTFHEGMPSLNVAEGFQSWPVVAFYVLAMVFLGLHLYHGAWSSFRTIGATGASPNPLRRPLAALIAIAIALGFAIIPLAVRAGLVRQAPRPPSAPVTAGK